LTGRRVAALVVLLLGAGVAACGGTASGTPIPGAGSPGPTAAPATAPSFSFPDFSFALPSFEANPELEAMFPDQIAGQPVEVLSMTGTSFMAGASGTQLAPVLQQLDAKAADMSVAFGGTAQVTVVAFKIEGVSAQQFFSAYIATAQGAQGAAIADASYGGKAVKKIVPLGADVVYLYLHGDVTWTVGGTALTDALLTETFSKLP
jgi:hypothetical protein